MTLVRNYGVTIVQTTLKANTTASGRMVIHYRQATYAQMKALVNAASFCYMPVRYDCIATQVCLSHARKI
ncbi:hypothetical protein NP493_455g00023 [Ridgeia piscesae]|uniref:Uncharacterized protein n=1 Tax=Ridgeia piscesae TaxID=27915 RepID=A0AAD9NUS8_RIDPI|nr:hypothetical protein NP493_455g00023 [Ridgeia piscesae]